jgi:hypothetical protein
MARSWKALKLGEQKAINNGLNGRPVSYSWAEPREAPRPGGDARRLTSVRPRGDLR